MIRFDKGMLLVILLSVFINFFNLGAIPLLDPDEPVYAETPKEMFQYNEFMSPRIYGEYWYDKPPLYYWLVAGSYKLFGVNEFAARFPSAALAVVSVAAVYAFTRRWLGDRTAVFSGVVLATSIEYFYLAKAAVTDITLVSCLTFALLCFWDKRYYCAYFFAGLATLAKGPIGLLFPGGILACYLLFSREFGLLLRMKLGSGMLVYSIVALPWYWFMYKMHGNAFIDTFIGFHNVTRFTSPEHPEGVLWYYYIPVLLLGFFPWISLLPQALWRAIDTRGEKGQLMLFLTIWASFIFLFFSVSQTKLVSYILPMYPPLAILVGWYIAQLSEQYPKPRPYCWAIGLTVISVLLGGGMIFGLKEMPQLAYGVYMQLGVLTVMLAAVWWFVWRKDYAWAVGIKVTAMTAFAVILVGVMFPVAAPLFTSKNIAAELTRQYDGKSSLYVIKFLRPGVSFYSGLYGTEIKTESELQEAMGKEGKAYYLIRKSEHSRLPDTLRVQTKILADVDDKILLEKSR